MALAHAFAQHGFGRIEGQDAPGHAQRFGQRDEGCAPLPADEGGVDQHRLAGLQRIARHLQQAGEHAVAGGLAVDAAGHMGAAGLGRQTEQALALHVGAHAHQAALLDQRLRLAALARAADAHGERQPRLARCGQLGGQLHVAVSLLPRWLALRIVVALAGAQGGHFGAHQGAVHGVVGQAGQGAVVARALQPGVQKTPGQRRLAMGVQVHEQEGDVAGHVDPAQARVELDGVEQARTALQPQQVAQVQVAMAFAHPAFGAAGGHQRRQVGAFGLHPLLQLF